MAIFITGVTGFVGSHLANALKKEDHVVGLVHDCKTNAWLEEALDGIVKVVADIRDFHSLMRIINQYDVSQCYHIAARASVKQAYKDPLNTYDINVMGTVALLEACRQLNVKKVLLLETDKVYGEKLNATVTDPYHPSEPYATSKMCQGFIARSYIETYGMNIVIPHSCNAFGYDPFSSRIFPNTIKSCFRGQSPIIFTNDKSVREYVYVEDLVDALLTLMKGDYNGPYNIATGWVCNQKEIVMKILRHFPSLEPAYVTGNLPPQIQEETMKITRWEWKPKITFDESIKLTIDAFRRYGL